MTTHAPAGERLSAGTLARRLGVAPTTLRTWHQRYGLGPTGHESGRHRRYTEGDVAALTAMARLTTRGVSAAEAARRARRELTPWHAEHPCADDAAARGLARAARRMDVLALREALSEAVAGHGVVHTWEVLADPAFTRIGHGRYPAARRALAERALARGLSEVFAAVPRPPAGSPVPVLLAGADGRRATAGLDALAAALAEHGTMPMHLGAGLEPELLAEAVAGARPVAVVVWSPTWCPEVAALLAGLAGTPGVVTAGWPGADAPRLADAVAVTLNLAGR
ncbi:MerR family transcriptional regulator [Actinoplanes sp. G11-F43]|uniref:MerR family transcriptional regulator n=1 Tax=Actinoplanes sp. G11-F43 TaxID=3424130 RepID=UPI003D337528